MTTTTLTFTPDELATLHRAAQVTWAFLALDGPPGDVARRDVIARVVAAPARLEAAISRLPHPPALLVKLRVCDAETLTAALKHAFPNPTPGR